MTSATDEMIWIPEGEFHMGTEHFYPQERPLVAVWVDGFWMDSAPVTNRDFSRFVDTTGYVTVAERDLAPEDYPGVGAEDLAAGSLVFMRTRGPVDLGNPGNWWRFVKGANWREPASLDHPVAHVAYADAHAYADWLGKSLPTEAEWEYAARGGLDGAAYPWGNDFYADGKAMANTWEGDFPWRNTERDGYTHTSPVGTYPPPQRLRPVRHGGQRLGVDRGLVERVERRNQRRVPCPGEPLANPRGGSERDSLDAMQPEIRIPRKVLKGGSHLCAPNYCLRYRPAARIPQMIDTATSHIGFRCVVRDD